METLPAVTALRKTPLHAIHRAAGARMTDFGGWDMPVEYSGIIAEHTAVRTGVGLFDVSHMGEIEIRGPQALDFVNYVTSNDASRLVDGQVQYSGLLYPNGTFVDDILVHRLGQNDFFLCVNASNQEKDFEWITSRNRFDAQAELTSEHYAQLAIQGPQALATLSKLTDAQLDSIAYYHFTRGEVLEVEALIARTGYTGEDGCEIYVPPEDGPPALGGPCSMRVPSSESFRAVSGLATRCASKRPCRSTGTRSTTPLRLTKRDWGGSLNLTKATSSDARR